LRVWSRVRLNPGLSSPRSELPNKIQSREPIFQTIDIRHFVSFTWRSTIATFGSSPCSGNQLINGYDLRNLLSSVSHRKSRVLDILPDAYYKATPESLDNQPYDQQCCVHRSYEADMSYVQSRPMTLNSRPPGGDTDCFKAHWLAPKSCRSASTEWRTINIRNPHSNFTYGFDSMNKLTRGQAY
jgi:hypothetical protein